MSAPMETRGMKAWLVEPKELHTGYSSYVLAETSGKAISRARNLEPFDGNWEFIELKAAREPRLDGGWTPQQFIDGGFCGWWTCWGCERHVGDEDDMTVCADPDDDATCVELTPVYTADRVFCSEECRRNFYERVLNNPIPVPDIDLPKIQTHAALSNDF